LKNLFIFAIILYMSKTKSAGSTKLGRDSKPKYLGVKRASGQKVKSGEIIIRQRGAKYLPGVNVGVGKDHTLFALTEGIVQFKTKNKKLFTGTKRKAKVVSVV